MQGHKEHKTKSRFKKMAMVLAVLLISMFTVVPHYAGAQNITPVNPGATYVPATATPVNTCTCTCLFCCDCGCICCTSVVATHAATHAVIQNEHRHLTETIFGNTAGILNLTPGSTWEVPQPPAGTNRLQEYEGWLLTNFWWDYILPAMAMMTEQLVSTMMQQMMIVGAFMDAKTQMETQMLFQELAARAHKDYHPSFGMCEIGTNTRSLAAATFKGELSQLVLNKQFLDRQLGNGGSVGSGGPESDRLSSVVGATPTPHNRLGYFLTQTCDRYDLNREIANPVTGLWLCATQPGTEGWVNRDIDWNNTVMGPRTINVDYSTTFAESASDNERLFQFSNYLYGHTVFYRPDGELLRSQKNIDNILDSRSVTAKRSIAQSSFNNIVGLKSRGTRNPEDPGSPRNFSSEEASDFVHLIMVELGFPPGNAAEYRRYLFQKDETHEPPGAAEGERDEISYYAQMEVLAKKIYQRPEFYTELYDKPANIKRKSAAMQTIKLMLDRDIFESQLRSEAIMSMILELKVVEEQQNIENKLGLMQERTR